MPSTEGLIAKNLRQRLDSLTECVRQNPRSNENGGVNLHIHTNESFSIFGSPTEAVWQAYLHGIEYFGICDHYTTAGHDEFRRACAITRLKAVFSVEIATMDAEAQHRGIRVNDPHNPGRVYLIAKGITRSLRKGSTGFRLLHSMRRAIRKRNTAIVSNLNGYIQEKDYRIRFRYTDAVALTPHGNVTERHVIQALCEKINGLTVDSTQRKVIYEDLIGTPIEEAVFHDPWELQELVRSSLIRSGKPCYITEDPSAFSSVEEVIRLFLEFGAVPTYSVMANPITPEEQDIERLLRKVKKKGLYAFDLLEFRTEEERAREVIETAAQYGFPVFIGTEHNIKRMLPMIGDICRSSEFYGYLRKSADFVLGHQILSELCDFGYVTPDGRPRFGDLKENFRFFAGIGELQLSEEQIKELKKKDLRERRRYFDL